MPTLAQQAQRQLELRQRALKRMGGPAVLAAETASPSLAILHGLALSPATAPDALALLHELQVHQVEIELQNEELRAAAAESEARLRRMIERVERAPAAYLTVDDALVIVELNAAAAALFGCSVAAGIGRPLGTLLPVSAVAKLRALLSSALPGGEVVQALLSVSQAAGGATALQSLHALVAADAEPRQWLLMLLPQEGRVTDDVRPTDS